MSNQQQQQQTLVQVKLVLLGDAAVGKSSIVLRFVKNQFSDFHQATVGAAFLTHKCRIPEDPSRVIRFEIWDTAGQERFHSLAPMYYRNSQAAIVVYDISNMETFERAKTWILELRRHADPNIIIALAGNKCDLGKSSEKKIAVSADLASSFAADEGLLFYETSAKAGLNIVEMFTDIARNVPMTNARMISSPSGTPPLLFHSSGSTNDTVTLNGRAIAPDTNTCYC